jgi:translation initiation factor 4G
MARTASHDSSRPPSSIGHTSHTPTPSQQGISQAPGPQGPSAASSFVRPKKTSAIKITDANGNAVNFGKPAAAATSSTQSQGPVIVSTPNAPTPPPRVPSAQHNRTESKAPKSSEETKTAFAEQVKRQIEEEKRKEQEKEAAAKAGETKAEDKTEAPKETEKAPADAPVKEAEAAAEKSAAVAADDEEGAKAAEAKSDEAKDAPANDEDEAARKKREEDEELERQIAEMEALEREEEERERAYNEKKAKQKAEADARKKDEAARLNTDDELKRQEREAEERELARERERNGETKAEEPDAEAKKLFASLKKPTLGPGANAQDNETSEDSSNEQSTSQSAPPRAGAQKPKPAHLKLETNKTVERAEPTPGMQALKSARFLALQEEAEYPSGFKSPNPALNQSTQRKGHAYDRDFLLQFQSIFKEKPSVDWDQKVRDTLGPGDDSARPNTARTPSSAGGRQASRGGSGMGFPGGAMGAFGSGAQRAPVGSGTTSAERFAASNNMGPPRPGQPGMVRAPSNLGLGAPGNMSRTNSLQMGAMGGPGGARQTSQRGPGGRGGSKRDDRTRSRREDADSASKMPLTAGQAVAPLDKSTSGWKPSSIVGGTSGPAQPDPSGTALMAPDMVQRKVKAALNKMTPEKFEKISDQILEIAAQSKHETDGRTLRQVIQLTFEKACDEAHWAGMYAQFCHKMLTTMSPDIRDDTIKDKAGNPVIGGGLFRKYLLNRCQEEFERGWQANLPDKPEGESQEAALLSDEYYIAAAAKRRGLGLIQFIGQLYKLRMLTVRIMHECVLKLLNFEGDPDEAAIENLTTLLKAIGHTMDQEEQGRPCIAMYFGRINNVLENAALASRPRFMLLDLVDLRKAGWRGKDANKGPKTIQEIHADAEAAAAKAEAERQRTSRGGPGGGRPQQGRGDARFAGGPPPPVDYSRTNVAMDDLKRLSQRSQNRNSVGGSMGPGGGLGPSMLGARTGSRRGLGGLGPGSGNSTRTSTPPVDAKKDEPPSAAQNAFRYVLTPPTPLPLAFTALKSLKPLTRRKNHLTDFEQ